MTVTKKNLKMSAVFWPTIIALPLIVGLGVYLIFKPTAFVSVLIYNLLRLHPGRIKPADNFFCFFVRFYLCDLLWAFSLTAVVQLILGCGKKQAAFSLLICIFVGLLIELLQKQGILSGTFDIWDLVVETIGAVLSIIITITFTRRKRDEKQNC